MIWNHYSYYIHINFFIEFLFFSSEWEMVFTLPCFLSTLLTLVMPHFLPDQFVKRNKTIFVIYIIMILLYFGWFFNELWKFWTFGESLTLLGFKIGIFFGKGAKLWPPWLAFSVFTYLWFSHITSANFYCFLNLI